MFKCIYYYYYLFYKKILKDDEPHMLTKMALSASISFILITFCNTVSVYFFCKTLPTWLLLSIVLIVLFFLTAYMRKNNLDKQIVKASPKIFNSNKISIAFTLFFFLFTLSFMFWGVELWRYVKEINCQ